MPAGSFGASADVAFAPHLGAPAAARSRIDHDVLPLSWPQRVRSGSSAPRCPKRRFVRIADVQQPSSLIQTGHPASDQPGPKPGLQWPA